MVLIPDEALGNDFASTCLSRCFRNAVAVGDFHDAYSTTLGGTLKIRICLQRRRLGRRLTERAT